MIHQANWIVRKKVEYIKLKASKKGNYIIAFKNEKNLEFCPTFNAGNFAWDFIIMAANSGAFEARSLLSYCI